MLSSANKAVVTGMGAITPVGTGIKELSDSLKKGATNFSVASFDKCGETYTYPVARSKKFDFKTEVERLELGAEISGRVKRIRNISVSTEYGMYTALEAWKSAGITPDINLSRIAIVSGGTNTQQSSLQQVYDRYEKRIQFLNPNYGINFFDTDIIGVLSECLGIRGEGYSIGAASASGNMALIQGCRLINSGEYDIVMVVAPMMDLSVFEFQGFTSLGAMYVLKEGVCISDCYRPFDTDHNGFVYGQSAGCIILESNALALKRNAKIYGHIEGYGVAMDANRNPDPSPEGELRAMQSAVEKAGIEVNQIHYVNTHGSGSKAGDHAEVQAMLSLGLKGVKANSTKSLIGHGLTAAGVIEAIASLIQMNENFLHKSNNLITPINSEIEWVTDFIENSEVNYTLTNSFGFGGINTSIIFRK